jgi:hypothetical protein
MALLFSERGLLKCTNANRLVVQNGTAEEPFDDSPLVWRVLSVWIICSPAFIMTDLVPAGAEGRRWRFMQAPPFAQSPVTVFHGGVRMKSLPWTIVVSVINRKNPVMLVGFIHAPQGFS